MATEPVNHDPLLNPITDIPRGGAETVPFAGVDTPGAAPAMHPPQTDAAVVKNDDTIDVLNDLLATARDGEYGFRACAEEVESPRLKPLFQDRAEQCREAGQELIALIARLGGETADGGTAQGAMHRGWMKVKAAVGADGEKAILEECERGEDAAIASYRKALKRTLPVDVRAVVEKQAAGAQRNHDQIRDLRNAARAADEKS